MSQIEVSIDGSGIGAIVAAIVEGASLMGVTNPFEAEPVFRYVDVSALETLLDHADHADRTGSDLVVEFTAGDLLFAIDGGETVIVSDRTREADP